MRIMNGVPARMALLAWVIASGGCAIGTAYVSAPDRLPANTLPPLARPLMFDVCQPDAGPAREAIGKRVETALSQAGVRADLAAAGSPVDFTVVFGHAESGPDWIEIVSILTFSIVPGLSARLKTLNVTVAWRDAAHGERREHLRYQARTYLVTWLPLIVAADVMWIMGDGWESARAEDGGFRQMVKRLGDDIRARLGRPGVESPVPGGGGVSCSFVLRS
jgi:hypothetical protein